MGYRNGQVPASALTTLLDGNRLLNSVAVSVLTLVHVARLEGTTVTTPSGGDRGISGYRDLARQALFLQAAGGDRAAAKRCNIDPTMRTNLGKVGSQSHGNADRIDLLFNGHSPDTDDLALVKRYGGVQEFGDDDRNHMWFKSRVGTVSESDKNRIVAHWLNGKSQDGETTNTDQDGVWPSTECHFSHMLQVQGRKDKLYLPPYKVDGIRGTRTKWLRDHYFGILFK